MIRRLAAVKLAILGAWIICSSLAGVASASQEPQPSATTGSETSIHIVRDVMIPMRDGVRLATDIYYPTVDTTAPSGPWPTVLTRTPYGKQKAQDQAMARHLAQHGYAVAIQDIRGRYASEGRFSKYAASEASDGFDSIEWLAKQAFSNGRIGMWGTSYAAHTQADAAKLDPPALKAMLLNQGGMANAWDHAVRHGGAFELGRELSWAFRQIAAESKDPVVRQLFERESVDDWYTALPLRRGLSPLSAAPEYEAYFLQEMTESDYGPHWRSIALNWTDYYAQTANAAMLHVGGWFDIFLRGTIENYQALSSRPDSRVQLLIGPWTHSGTTRTFAGEVDFGPEAALVDFSAAFHRRWFDRTLKQIASDSDEAPIRLFVMGGGDGRRNGQGRLQHGGYWTQSRHWPLAGTRFSRFYLQADGSLSRQLPTAGTSSTTYTFDPAHPVPTIGGNVSARLGDGAFDQRERHDFPGSRPPYLPLAARRDVLVFQTEPLQQDLVVVGPIEVELYVSSSAVDTDFTAKLIDMYPPSADYPAGFAMNISDALQRASYREGRQTRELIEPGKTYRLTIRPFASANIFKRGHRLRVDISSSNFPRFDVNPNSGEPMGQHRRLLKADNTVYHQHGAASYISLPILEAAPPASRPPW